MIDRKPDYIQINDEIIDLSQVSRISPVAVKGDVNVHYYIQLYVGINPFIRSYFESKNIRDRVLSLLRDRLARTQGYPITQYP